MPHIENTAFELRVSNHMFDTTKNVAGKFQNSTPADEECPAGFLVVPTGKLPNEGYSGVYNENAYLMGAAAEATAEEIYACNTFNVQELPGPFGTSYKVGTNTLGLPIPAGQRGTYTRIDEGDIMRLGVGNFASAPTVGQYASVQDGKLVPAADAPTTMGALYFEVLSTGTFTQGAYASFAYYLLRAHRVRSAVASPV